MGGQGGRTAFKSPHSLDQESQREERDSVIDAVKLITGAQTETPGWGRMTVGDTPEYHWDTGYDGIQCFSSHLRNRVSETSTPQGGQSPRGGPRTPPEPQRPFKQLKVMMRHQLVGHYLPYNKSGRPTCEKSLRKRVWIHHVTFVGALTMIIEIALKRPIGNPKMLGRVLLREGVSRGQCPNCNIPHPGICPCAWCDQPGHIAQDCMAHFADDSMRARFPKKEKMKRTPIKHYECHCCGGHIPSTYIVQTYEIHL